MCVFLCRSKNCPFISTFPSLHHLFAMQANWTRNNIVKSKTKKREYAEKMLFFVYGAASGKNIHACYANYPSEPMSPKSYNYRCCL